MDIIVFAAVFCWYLNCVGMSKLSLQSAKDRGIIDEYQWYHTYITGPCSYSYGFGKGLVYSVYQGVRFAIDKAYLENSVREE